MRTNLNLKLVALALLLQYSSLSAQDYQKEAIPLDPMTGIIDLLNNTPLVAIGETHEHAQLYEYLTELVQTEAFYKAVNDILIESGNALYQETLDLYISGEQVDMTELQKVWLNTTQSPVDPWGNELYFNFLKTVRNLNLRIEAQHRIRVIAADPPIKWEKVLSLEDYRAARGSRNTFYAQTAVNEVLSKNRRALMISGGAHFGHHNPRNTLVNQRIESVYPNSVTVVLAASGLGAANGAHEEKLKDWKRPALVKLKDTWIGKLPGPRRILRTAPTPVGASTNSNTATVSASPAPVNAAAPNTKQDFSDYLLYFGTREETKYGNVNTSVYISDAVWKEMNRRSSIRFNHELLPETRKTGSLRPMSYNE